MSLVKCVECGAAISSDAKACLKCSRRQSGRAKAAAILSAFAAGIFLVYCYVRWLEAENGNTERKDRVATLTSRQRAVESATEVKVPAQSATEVGVPAQSAAEVKVPAQSATEVKVPAQSATEAKMTSGDVLLVLSVVGYLTGAADACNVVPEESNALSAGVALAISHGQYGDQAKAHSQFNSARQSGVSQAESGSVNCAKIADSVRQYVRESARESSK